ncbi:MAG: hypothetical protein LCH84_17105 [Gemmatimonadetes bacterium]|nr:hypothetical protein [Gemmatimonadota bacterium]
MTGIAGALAQQRARSTRLLADATSVASAHAQLAHAQLAHAQLAHAQLAHAQLAHAQLAHAHDMRDAATVSVDARPALPVVLLPANTRPVVPLPDDARSAFLSHLASLVESDDTHQRGDHRSSPTASASHAPEGAASDAVPVGGLSSAMVAASCATCRGACCTAGGTHAFLRADALSGLQAVRAGVAADDASRLLALYAGYLPERHYQDSCVFHAEQGCALPGALRSDLCNRHLCGELGQLRRALDESGGRAAYVAAATRTELQRVVLLVGDEDGGCERVEIAGAEGEDLRTA